MKSMDCPTTEELVMYCREQLTPEAGQRVSVHLARVCTRCREELAFLRPISAAARVEFESPPPWATALALAIPDLREDEAALVYDSRDVTEDLPLAAVRSGFTANRKCVFASSNFIENPRHGRCSSFSHASPVKRVRNRVCRIL